MQTAILIALTVAAYLAARTLAQRYTHPLCNIIFVSTGLMMTLLVLADLSYADYGGARDTIAFFLGPATVALAVPVYRNLYLFGKYGWAIFASVGTGTVITVLMVVAIGKLGGLTPEIIASLAPKSATIPIAVESARIEGGNPALAVAFVVATGTFGSVLGLELLNRFRIKNPVARGLAMGTVSHGQGTAMAFTEGEQQGAMAGVAMALAGVLTALVVPVVLAMMV